MKNIVLYIGGFILPEGNAAAQRVMANAKILRELGYEVIFLGTVKRDLEKGKKILQTKRDVYGFEAYEIVYPSSYVSWFNHLFSTKEVNRLIQHIGEENIFGVIAYNYPSIPLKKLLRFCRKNEIKLLSDCTEWAVLEGRVNLKDRVKNYDTNYRMEKIHPKLDGMIAISRYLFDYYQERMQQVILLPPLVNKKDAKWKIEESIILEENFIQLVYAGSPGNGNKDRIDRVIETLSKIKDQVNRKVILNIIGITKAQYLEDFNKKDIPKNIKSNIRFKGRVPHSKALQYIKKAHYSIFIRDKNKITTAGFPTKFVESICCGTPVLTTKTSNIGEYLIEGEFGFFLDDSSDEKLEQTLIKALVVSKDNFRNMKEICCTTYIFDITAHKNRLEQFFPKVLVKK